MPRAEQIGLEAMTTEATNKAEAAAELAAIRRAKPVYRQSKAAAAKEAAEAAKEAAAKEAAAARAALPKSSMPLPEAKPARLAWHTINGREYAAADARAFWAEQRRLDKAARAAARAEARRAELASYSAGLVLDAMPEAELRAKAAAAGRAAMAAAEQHLDATARAAELGVDVADVLEADAIEAALAPSGRDETFGAAPEAGAASLLSPAELAELARFTRAALASPAAAAGRAALDSLGLTSTGIVSTNVYAGQTGKRAELAIGQVLSTPPLEAAEAKAAELAAAAAKAEARAEAADKAAATSTRVKDAKAAAEARANKAAAAAGKLAAKLARAEAALAAAKAAEEIPGHATGYYVLPVATLPLEAAAEAGKLAISHATGQMPASFAYRGPSAKQPARLVDNTANIAIANVLGQTAEAEAELARQLVASIAAKVAELEAKAAEAREQQRADYKARRAMAARQRRRNAKQRNK